MTRDLPALLEVARRVTAAAEHYFDVGGPGAIGAEGDRDMVSEIDVAIERQIRAALRDARPEIGFLGDEEDEDPPHAPTRWIRDSVDGTANFIRDMPLFGFSLALVHEQTAMLEVVVLPRLGRRYWAAAGLGAWLDGDPIRPAAVRSVREAMIAVGDFTLGRGDDERSMPQPSRPV